MNVRYEMTHELVNNLSAKRHSYMHKTISVDMTSLLHAQKLLSVDMT